MCINLLPRANVWWDVCVSSFSPKQMCGGCACLKIKNKYALLVLPKSLPGASVWWDVCKGSLTSFCIANFSYLYTCFYPCNLKHCFILYTRWAMMRMLLKLLICPPTQWSTGNVRQIKLFLVTYNNSFLHFTCLSPIMCCFPQCYFDSTQPESDYKCLCSAGKTERSFLPTPYTLYCLSHQLVILRLLCLSVFI